MRVKLAWLVREGGARPPPFTTFTLTSKVVVYAPAEWADTLTLFHLYQYMYSVPPLIPAHPLPLPTLLQGLSLPQDDAHPPLHQTAWCLSPFTQIIGEKKATPSSVTQPISCFHECNFPTFLSIRVIILKSIDKVKVFAHFLSIPRFFKSCTFCWKGV